MPALKITHTIQNKIKNYFIDSPLGFSAQQNDVFSKLCFTLGNRFPSRDEFYIREIITFDPDQSQDYTIVIETPLGNESLNLSPSRLKPDCIVAYQELKKSHVLSSAVKVNNEKNHFSLSALKNPDAKLSASVLKAKAEKEKRCNDKLKFLNKQTIAIIEKDEKIEEEPKKISSIDLITRIFSMEFLEFHRAQVNFKWAGGGEMFEGVSVPSSVSVAYKAIAQFATKDQTAEQENLLLEKIMGIGEQAIQKRSCCFFKPQFRTPATQKLYLTLGNLNFATEEQKVRELKQWIADFYNPWKNEQEVLAASGKQKLLTPKTSI